MDLVAGAGGIFGGLAVGLAGGMTGAGMGADGSGGPGGGGINGIMMAAASGKFGGMGPGGAGQHVKANIDSLPDKVISIFISALRCNYSISAPLYILLFTLIFPGPPEGLHVPLPPRDSRLLPGLQEMAHDSAGNYLCFSLFDYN